MGKTRIEVLKIADLFHNEGQVEGLKANPRFSTKEDRERMKRSIMENPEMMSLRELLVFPYVCKGVTRYAVIGGNMRLDAVKRLNEIGYDVQVFLLNAATMGVPQARQRVFFIGHRKEFKLPKLVLNFNEEPIKFGEIQEDMDYCNLPQRVKAVWDKRVKSDTDMGQTVKRTEGKVSLFNWKYVHKERVSPTKTTGGMSGILYDFPRYYTEYETKCVGTFPQDYKCEDSNQLSFLTGMSVPPVMTAQIAYQIYLQWLSKIE